MHFRDDVIAFIGPACAFALEPVARLAAYWNTPIITGMGDQPPSEGTLSVTSGILGRLHKLRNGSSLVVVKEDTLTRMSYCQCRLKLVFSSIFKQFSWNHVALLLDRSDLFSLTVGKHLEIGLRRAGTLSFVRELDGNEEDNCQAYLRDASMYARVVILSVRGLLVRRCMIAAHHLGMTRGDWTFLDVEIVQLFVRQHHRANHAANSTMVRLQRYGNSVAEDSTTTLKTKIAGLQIGVEMHE
ncbi:hypothetical protein J6590_043490 [Homalodisca vitripennis]|nr:hypothetical protein J6590_043490 [Homalodisca vitripennis]